MSADSLIAEFIGITGVGEDIAAAYLESCSNSIERAVDMYFRGDEPAQPGNEGAAGAAAGLGPGPVAGV